MPQPWEVNGFVDHITVHESACGPQRTRLQATVAAAFGGEGDIAVKCAPRAGQVEVSKLTVCAGLSKDESHGQTAFAQHRVQAAGGGGAHCR